MTTAAAQALSAIAVAAGLAASSPTPVPVPAAATGPGIWGFLVTFALVLACIPLFLSMTRKVRGVQYRGGAASGDLGEANPGDAPGPDRDGRPEPTDASRP